MGRPRKQRRKAHGSAWHWKQTDCWYYTLPSTKKRMPLFDEQGERIRGKENQALIQELLDMGRANFMQVVVARRPESHD